MLKQTYLNSSAMNEESITPIRAAIDIGSNTVRLVIARCSPHTLEILATEEELLRIGEDVHANGVISSQKQDETIALLSHYKTLVENYTSEPILLVATAAIREATNREEFLSAILSQTGLVVNLIDGDIEAILTFYGTTSALSQELHLPATIGVMDLGGGSTELVVAKNMQITWRTSLPIGSGWLQKRYLPSDPPSAEELEVAHVFLQTYFKGVRIKPSPPTLIVTGGSAQALLRLARYAFNVSDTETLLTITDLARCEELLGTLTADEIVRQYSLPLARVRILAAGALIIRTMLERLQLDSIRISSEGLREGVLLAYAQYGEHWLQRLQHPESVTVLEQDTGEKSAPHEDEEASIPFAELGRDLLLKYTDKMLKWRKDVLQNEDVEAVHRMRVASRRLRAVLDAYSSVCHPKHFKKAYRSVKDIADMLGQARDIDVMIINLQARHEQVSPAKQASIQWLIERLSSYRQQHQQKLAAFLKNVDRRALSQQIELCLPKGGFQNGKG